MLGTCMHISFGYSIDELKSHRVCFEVSGHSVNWQLFISKGLHETANGVI